MDANSILSSVGANSRRHEQTLRTLQQELSGITEQQLSVEQRIGSTLAQIAGYQMDGQLHGGAQISSQVQRLLDKRVQDEAELRRSLVLAEDAVAAQLLAVATLNEEFSEKAPALEQQLEQDELYQQQLALVESAVARCAEAAASYDDLREECQVKLQAFPQDEFTSYLKGRGFGTDRYTGSIFWRGLDRWLAGLCNFAQNSQAEQTLLAMQAANESAGVEREANRKVQVAELERLYVAAQSASDLAPLVKRQKQAQQLLEASKAKANSIHGRLDLYFSKQDEGFVQASTLLAQQLAAMSNVSLERLADQTSGFEDDELVRQVGELRAEQEELRRRVPSLEAQCNEASKRYERAKKLERGVQSDTHVMNLSNYPSLDMGTLVAEYMEGDLSVPVAMAAIEYCREQFWVGTQTITSSYTTNSSNGRTTRTSSSFFSTSSSTSSSSSSSSAPRSSGSGFSTSDSL